MGIFIVFEGIDGAGKGEQIKRLASHIFEKSKRYDEIVLTRNPTYKKHGAEIRRRLAEEKDSQSDAHGIAMLFIEDRKQCAKEIITPALARGATVLCDRYMMSTIAFQSAAGLTEAELLEAQKELPKPTITLVFDLPAEQALQRLGGGKEKFEKREFLEKVRSNYLRLAKELPEQKCAVIDASKSRDDVFAQIVSVLEKQKVLPY